MKIAVSLRITERRMTFLDLCHLEQSVAISTGKNSFLFLRLLHSGRNDIFYCISAIDKGSVAI